VPQDDSDATASRKKELRRRVAAHKKAGTTIGEAEVAETMAPPPGAAPPDADEDSADGEEFEVESLTKEQRRGRKAWFLVQWVGYGREHDTWEPEDNVPSDMVRELRAKNREEARAAALEAEMKRREKEKERAAKYAAERAERAASREQDLAAAAERKAAAKAKKDAKFWEVDVGLAQGAAPAGASPKTSTDAARVGSKLPAAGEKRPLEADGADATPPAKALRLDEKTVSKAVRAVLRAAADPLTLTRKEIKATISRKLGVEDWAPWNDTVKQTIAAWAAA